MKKIVVLAAVLAITACAPVLVTNQKTANYDKRISRLSILVAEPNILNFKQARTNTFAEPMLKSALSRSVTDLERAMKEALPVDFSAAGVVATLKADLSASEQVKSDGLSSHLLTIAPTGAKTSCYYNNCQTTVFVSAELRDLNVNAVAWVGKFEVPQASSFSSIDIETARRVTALLIDTFRRNNLMPATR